MYNTGETKEQIPKVYNEKINELKGADEKSLLFYLNVCFLYFSGEMPTIFLNASEK